MKPPRPLNRQGVPILDPPRNGRGLVGPTPIAKCPPHRYVIEKDIFRDDVELCVRCGKRRGMNSW